MKKPPERLSDADHDMLLSAMTQRDNGASVFAFVSQHIADVYRLGPSDSVTRTGVIQRPRPKRERKKKEEEPTP